MCIFISQKGDKMEKNNSILPIFGNFEMKDFRNSTLSGKPLKFGIPGSSGGFMLILVDSVRDLDDDKKSVFYGFSNEGDLSLGVLGIYFFKKQAGLIKYIQY
jgi:hypothetical protein